MSDMDTSALVGCACKECGDDADLITALEGRDVPLCAVCYTDQTTICPRCEQRIWQSEGYRACSTPDLYCGTCHNKIETALMTATLLPDERRDDMNERRR